MNKLYNQNIKTEEAIGKAKTVLVSIEGPAVVTSISTRTIEYNESARLVFTGLVKVEEKIKKHLNNIILPTIDEILNHLKIPMQSYDISVANIGAISSSDSEFIIEGYSADVPIFLAILSASLKLPIKQNTLFTGHISSREGDIGQVKGLVEKSEAALREQGISEFVYPGLTEDNSLKVLKPKEYERTVSAIRSCRGRIILTEVANIEELIKKALSDESIVLSSFFCEYYYKIKSDVLNEPHPIIQYFVENNDKRFWKSLESNLINRQVEKVHKLLNQHFSYHNKQNKYPQNYGVDLRNLIFSLSLSSKKTEGLFPLLLKEQYIKLIQFAEETDYEDISYLHDVVFNKVSTNKRKIKSKESNQIKNNVSAEIIDYILEKLNPHYIDTIILKPIDEARSSYIFDKNNVDSYEELIESITNFYVHVIRHTSSQSIIVEKEKYLAESLDLFKKTYTQKSEYEYAISNGINGYNGGMRAIFDRITKYLKIELKDKHIDSIINESIDPNNYELKKSLIEVIIKRENSNLDIDKSLLISAKYVENYIEIIKEYANSKYMLNPIFSRL